MADLTNQQLLYTMTNQLGIITDQMITKDDLKAFVTKANLKGRIKSLRYQSRRKSNRPRRNR